MLTLQIYPDLWQQHTNNHRNGEFDDRFPLLVSMPLYGKMH